MSVRLRALVAAVATALLGALLVALPAGPAQAATTPAPSWDARLLVLINQARLQAGLSPVGLWDPLASQAAAWSRSMAGSDNLHHDSAYATKAATICTVRVARENVGYTTGSADSLFRAYMNSPGHRANILSSDTQFLGLGTVSEPWSKSPSTPIYWNTMRFVGGQCPKPSYVTSSTPSTMTLVPRVTSSTPGASFALKAALVAPKGPSRTATLTFTPSATGVTRTVRTVTLTASSTYPTIYRASVSVTQAETGTWRLSYDGVTVSSSVGDRASARAVGLSSKTVVSGWSGATTTTAARTTMSDGIVVSPARDRTLYHQYRTCSSCAWKTYKTYAVPADGRLTLVWPAYTGTRYWRAYVPRAASGLAAATPVRTVTGS